MSNAPGACAGGKSQALCRPEATNRRRRCSGPGAENPEGARTPTRLSEETRGRPMAKRHCVSRAEANTGRLELLCSSLVWNHRPGYERRASPYGIPSSQFFKEHLLLSRMEANDEKTFVTLLRRWDAAPENRG